MDEDRIEKIITLVRNWNGGRIKTLNDLAEQIDEISFKAGIKLVVKEVEKVSQMVDTNGGGTDDPSKAIETIYYIGKGRLEAFLKEKGLVKQ